MNIIHLELLTHRLEEMKRFYGYVLNMKQHSETDNSFTLQAGNTLLRFTAVLDQSEPFYHFAFTIPQNKIKEARDWLKNRVNLLAEEGEEIVHFVHSNARSLYFYDPAGNLVEFTARHNLENDTPAAFSDKDILCVSEIGLPVDDVLQTVEDIEVTLGIPQRRKAGGDFASMGDDHGVFIIVPIGRLWFMSNKAAYPHPVKVTIQGGSELQIRLKTYHVHMVHANE